MGEHYPGVRLSTKDEGEIPHELSARITESGGMFRAHLLAATALAVAFVGAAVILAVTAYAV
jgi:hypothetical protein